jgi:hypothetical protein
VFGGEVVLSPECGPTKNARSGWPFDIEGLRLGRRDVEIDGGLRRDGDPRVEEGMETGEAGEGLVLLWSKSTGRLGRSLAWGRGGISPNSLPLWERCRRPGRRAVRLLYYPVAIRERRQM